MQQEQDKKQGAVAGYPIEEDDVITGATIQSARGKRPSSVTTRSGGQRLGKNKSRFKGQSSQRTSSGDVVVASEDASRSVSNPATKNELIERIRSIPDSMLPKFIKKYADIMVNKFGIDTRERVANFLGQVNAESLRGVAEYVYYTTPSALRRAFGGRVTPSDSKNFIYNENNLQFGNYGFPQGKPTPWQINGLNDAYYGSRTGPRNGNRFNRISESTNDSKSAKPNSRPNPDLQINPGFYKGSPDGYAYRGHGIIQITGKVQYEKMNKYFGKNGTFEKNDIDFVKNPELVHYNWKNPSEPSKFAFLAAMMWWYEHKGVYINKVSLSTTKTITATVKGNSARYQERHTNTQRYYNFLIGKPSKSPNTKSEVIVTVNPSKIRFLGGNLNSAIEPEKFKDLYKISDYSNLSFFEGDGSATPPYKDLSGKNLNNPFGYAVFTISNNNVAKIYRAKELNPDVWKNIKYACAGTPIMVSGGSKLSGFAGSSRFLRTTGRTAIGIKPDGNVVVCVLTNARLEKVRDTLASQGCIDAINFDGGGSTFAFVGGQKVISDDGRKFPTVMSWT